VITSSPAFTPTAISASKRASLPDAHPIACFRPAIFCELIFELLHFSAEYETICIEDAPEGRFDLETKSTILFGKVE
jgi:hypothetical protein